MQEEPPKKGMQKEEAAGLALIDRYILPAVEVTT